MRLKYSVLLLAIALTGCDNKKDEIGCSSEITQSALMDLLKKSAYEGLSEQVDKYPDVTNLKWSTKTGHRVRVFSSIDFPIRLVVTHHYIRAVLVRCNIQRY
ncbi:hypothetical protein QUG11_25575, partial [Escherichia coli]|nr:hypothetical protein [Escherichia coli]